jgi:ATP-dependent Clp protease ATP-binding subunit ClpC
LDDGILTDNHGEKISFKDTVIIMTTNVGVEEFQELDKLIGFGADAVVKNEKVRQRETRKALEKTFPPEFLNRIDEIVTFRALTKEDNMEIFDILIKEVLERLEKMGMKLIIPPDVKEFIVDQGTNVKYGARPLKRAIKKYVESPLSEDLLNKKFKKGDVIIARVDGEDVVFEHYKEEKDDKKEKKSSKKTTAKKSSKKKTSSKKTTAKRSKNGK